MDMTSDKENRNRVRQKDVTAKPWKTGRELSRAPKSQGSRQAGPDYIIRNAQPQDFPALHELLTTNHLTTAGVTFAEGTYFTAVRDGSLLGMVGFEKYGSTALLRSFAVQSKIRGSGLGAALIDHLLAHLDMLGLSPVFLLTNTAAPYLKRFGFTKINREEIPSAVLESLALGSSCPAGSTCMKRG